MLSTHSLRMPHGPALASQYDVASFPEPSKIYSSMKRLLLACLLLGQVALAQNELDALRHSQTGLSGTARALGMGGAYSAVGADLTSATLNPAGLGLYRSSTFTISPSFAIHEAQTSFLGTSERGNTRNLGIPNWGFAFNTLNYYDNGRTREEVKEGLKSYTFAFGHNQLENYHRNTVVQGAFNPHSSISQMFAERAEGLLPTQLGVREGTAFDLLVIDTIFGGGGRRYFPAAGSGQVGQSLQIEESGRRNEWFVALAGNFSDKLFIGASIGIQQLRYTQSFNFIERDVNNRYEFYDPFEDNGFPLEIPTDEIRFSEDFTTRGTGINGKIGLLYRPSDALRLGVSAQTPTYLSLTDEFNFDMVHVITLDPDAGPEEFFPNPAPTPGRFEYNLLTPFRVTAGGMYLFQKIGFLSMDVEYVDYASANLSSATNSITDPAYYAFTDENQAILNQFRPAVNYRLGGEVRYNIARFRAGFALYGSPLSSQARDYLSFEDLETVQQIDGSRRFLTLGVGVRQPNFYLDVSLVNQVQETKTSPYSLVSPNLFQPTAVSDRMSNMIMTSIGFTF